jgi:Family of unknown function (DUF6200)
MATTPVDTALIETTPVSHAGQAPPVVLDLGKTKKKLIRELKRGEGKLMADVAEAVEAVRSNLSSELDGKVLVPVVIVYQRKASRKGAFLPFSF